MFRRDRKQSTKSPRESRIPDVRENESSISVLAPLSVFRRSVRGSDSPLPNYGFSISVCNTSSVSVFTVRSQLVHDSEAVRVSRSAASSECGSPAHSCALFGGASTLRREFTLHLVSGRRLSSRSSSLRIYPPNCSYVLPPLPLSLLLRKPPVWSQGDPHESQITVELLPITALSGCSRSTSSSTSQRFLPFCPRFEATRAQAPRSSPCPTPHLRAGVVRSSYTSESLIVYAC